MSHRIAYIFVVLSLLAASLLGGCTKVQARPASEAALPAAGPTVLKNGDIVEIKFRYYPELNDTQTIRADGMLSLQLVGDVVAAGIRPSELNAKLAELYTAHLLQPAVTVVLRNELNRRVFVGGSVANPGALEMPGELSVFDALMLAGGLDYESAAVGHVIVMRSDADGLRQGFRVDLRPVLRGEATRPFPLAPGDHVYVPRTQIVNVNQFVRQYVGGLIPNGLNITRSVGSTTYGVDTAVFDN